MTTLLERAANAPHREPGRPARWLTPAAGVVLVALLAGYLIRVYRLEAPSIWWDEGYSAYLAQQGWREALRLTAADIHPPLYYFLLKLWVAVAGTSEFALRYLSVLISLLILPVTFVLVRRLLGSTVAAVSAAVLAIAPYQWAFAQDARMYPLEALLGVALVGLTYLVCTTAGRRAGLLAGVLAAVIAVSLYVDYFPIVLVAALGLWVAGAALLTVRPWAAAAGVAGRYALAVLGGLVLYLPWLRIGFGQVASYGAGRSTAPDAAGYVAAAWAAFLAGPAVVPAEHAVALALAALGLAAGWAVWALQHRETGAIRDGIPKAGRHPCHAEPFGCAQDRLRVDISGSRPGVSPGGSHHRPTGASNRRLPRAAGAPLAMTGGTARRPGASENCHRSQSVLGGSLVLWWVAGSVAALGLVLVLRPFFHVRYLSVAGPGMAVAIALALVALWRWRPPAAVLATGPLIWLAVAGAAGYHGDKRFARDDTRATAAFLNAEVTARDLVLWQTPYPFSYYYRGPAEAVAFNPNEPGAESRLAALAAGRDRVFLQTWYQSVDDPAGKAPFLLARGGRLLGERDFPGYRLSWFAVGDYTPPDLQPIDWSFGGLASVQAVAFGAAEGLSRQVPADGAVWVRTQWAMPPAPDDDLKYYLRLADSSGADAGRVDAWVYDGRGLSSRHWQPGTAGDGFTLLRVPAGTPPGRYGVFLGAYLASGRQLGLVGGTTAEARLGEIEVIAPRGPQEVPAGVQRIDGPVVQLGDRALRLVGTAGLGAAPVVVGQGRPVRLLWRVEPAGSGRAATLRVGGETLPLQLESAAQIADWPAGALLWQRVIARAAAPGQAPVAIEAGGQSYLLGTLDVRDRAVQRELPPDLTTVEGQPLAQGLTLAGYRTSRAGEALTLELYWRAAAPFAGERKSFVHVLDGTGKLVAQADAVLGEGAAPADALVPGEVLVDRRTLHLPPGGPYRLIAGVYDGATGAREPVAGGGDTLEILTLEASR